MLHIEPISTPEQDYALTHFNLLSRPEISLQKPLIEVKTLREMWESYNGVYFEQGIIDKMFSLIKEYSPE